MAEIFELEYATANCCAYASIDRSPRSLLLEFGDYLSVAENFHRFLLSPGSGHLEFGSIAVPLGLNRRSHETSATLAESLWVHGEACCARVRGFERTVVLLRLMEAKVAPRETWSLGQEIAGARRSGRWTRTLLRFLPVFLYAREPFGPE